MTARTILVVQADAATGGLLHTELRAIRSWVVAVAPDAATVRRLVREIRFEVLVLDTDLPDEDGLALLTALRSARDWHEPPVIVTSDNPDRPGLATALARKEVAHVLGKPFAVDVLIGTIRGVLTR